MTGFFAISSIVFGNHGPSDWFRTSGLVVPNHALYHLSYTRL